MLFAFTLTFMASALTNYDSVCMSDGCAQGVSMIQRQQVLQKTPSVHISEDWLKVNNKEYSRKGAHDAVLGRIGRTSWQLQRPAMINFKTEAPHEWLEENIKISTEVTLSSEQSNQFAAAIRAAVPTVVGGVAGVTSGNVGVNGSSSHDASYVLRGMTIQDHFRVKHWFNEDANPRLKQDFMDMYDWVHKPRIVTTVWVLVSSAEENAMSCSGGHLTLDYTTFGASVGGTISGIGCAKSSWTFSPDTIIAYSASFIETTEWWSTPPGGKVKNIVEDTFWTR